MSNLNGPLPSADEWVCNIEWQQEGNLFIILILVIHIKQLMPMMHNNTYNSGIVIMAGKVFVVTEMASNTLKSKNIPTGKCKRTVEDVCQNPVIRRDDSVHLNF